MRFLDTNVVFAIYARANLCLAVIAGVAILLREITPLAVALNMGAITLAIIAWAATTFLFVRHDRQKRFLIAVAVSSAGR
jgi:hypothetical protein